MIQVRFRDVTFASVFWFGGFTAQMPSRTTRRAEPVRMSSLRPALFP